MAVFRVWALGLCAPLVLAGALVGASPRKALACIEPGWWMNVGAANDNARIRSIL
jgi:hypothetical protein